MHWKFIKHSLQSIPLRIGSFRCVPDRSAFTKNFITRSKAVESYGKIVARKKELDSNASPSLKTVLDMARWRTDFIQWQVRPRKLARRIQPPAFLPLRRRDEPARNGFRSCGLTRPYASNSSRLFSAENQSLCSGDSTSTYEYYQGRKNSCHLLNQSLNRLKKHRVEWQRLSPEERAQYPQIATLIRSSQESINKVLVMDRENEHAPASWTSSRQQASSCPTTTATFRGGSLSTQYRQVICFT